MRERLAQQLEALADSIRIATRERLAAEESIKGLSPAAKVCACSYSGGPTTYTYELTRPTGGSGMRCQPWCVLRCGTHLINKPLHGLETHLPDLLDEPVHPNVSPADSVRVQRT